MVFPAALGPFQTQHHFPEWPSKGTYTPTSQTAEANPRRTKNGSKRAIQGLHSHNKPPKSTDKTQQLPPTSISNDIVVLCGTP